MAESLSPGTRLWYMSRPITDTSGAWNKAMNTGSFEPDLIAVRTTERCWRRFPRVVDAGWRARQRFMKDYQLPRADAETFVMNVRAARKLF